MIGEIGKVLMWLESFLWNAPFIGFVLITGLVLFASGNFFTIRHLGHILKQTLGAITSKEANTKREGYISPFEAVCIAIGGCVGAGNIAGVATAIAVGGPGAAFWLVMFGFFAMAIKLAEASLASHYRHKDEAGYFTAGPMWYMEKGLGRDLGKKAGFVLAFLFCFGFMCQALGGSQVYTISEVLKSVYGFNPIVVTLVYTAIIYACIWHGLPGVAKIAVRLVPFMCVAFIVAGFGLIMANLEALPGALYLIFHDAFTGSAAVGGFVGATVMHAMRSGLARSINSNEAGQGSSGFAHGTADTIHPIRQGLWGCLEAFMDTIIICNMTAVVVIVTGTWDSGVTGGSLSYMAYQTLYGEWGGYLLSVILMLFGLTTTSGWFVYYTMIIAYFFRKHPIGRDRTLLVFKLLFPLTNVVIVSYIYLTGNGPVMFWTMVSVLLVPGIFVNLLALFMLRSKFLELLKDYKARYLGIGEVDPNFHVFYEDNPEVHAREEAIREEMREIVRRKRSAVMQAGDD